MKSLSVNEILTRELVGKVLMEIPAKHLDFNGGFPRGNIKMSSEGKKITACRIIKAMVSKPLGYGYNEALLLIEFEGGDALVVDSGTPLSLTV
jgi:hypothetical protein